MSGHSANGGLPGPRTLTPPLEAARAETQTPHAPREPRPSEWVTCRCSARWTGLNAAHCAACHCTFASPGLFDRHRHAHGEHGGCADPAAIVTATGERVMFYRGGMWRTPEMTEQTRARLRGSHDH